MIALKTSASSGLISSRSASVFDDALCSSGTVRRCWRARRGEPAGRRLQLIRLEPTNVFSVIICRIRRPNGTVRLLKATQAAANGYGCHQPGQYSSAPSG